MEGFMLFLFLGFFLCLVPEARAYLDPGTGSMIIQVVIGGVLAVSYTVKVYWKKIKTFFFGKKNSNS